MIPDPSIQQKVLYARVSSDRQEHEETIKSQLAEIRVHLAEACVEDWLELLDEGYARDDLKRPGLDELRDLIRDGKISTVYVQAPDRLASGYKLVLLVEEFQEKGVTVVFLKGSVEDSPEGKLLLHIQGATGEFERTKIAERTRRGKLYWAKQGAMVGGHAPYGYKFIRRTDGKRASLEISDIEASVVREMYRLLVEDRLSTRRLCRHLEERRIPTPRGAKQWSPTTVDRILRNRVYKGVFYYQRTESVLPTKRLTNDPYKQSRKTGSKPRPEGDWIGIPVPAIIDEPTWDAVQEQLHQSSLHSPRNNKRHAYLLRGLIRCPRCGGNYTGHFGRGNRGYRYQNHDSVVTSTGKSCRSGRIFAEPVEDAVWQAVTEAFQNPDLLAKQYENQMAQYANADHSETGQKQIKAALKKAKTQEDRATAAYMDEYMDRERYGAVMAKISKHRLELERQIEELDLRQRQEQDSQSALENLGRFCRQVTQGLDAMSFDDRQQLLRLVVEGITVENDIVRVETVIPQDEGNLRNRRPELVEGCAQAMFTTNTKLNPRSGSTGSP
jgi:site-specific DNA recombinase